MMAAKASASLQFSAPVRDAIRGYRSESGMVFPAQCLMRILCSTNKARVTSGPLGASSGRRQKTKFASGL